MKPRNSLVLVEIMPEPREKTTEQGIIIPSGTGGGRASQGNLYRRARVINFGPGAPIEGDGHRVGMEDLRVGQTVLIKSGTYQQVDVQRAETEFGAKVVVGGKEQVLINQVDVLAIISEPDAAGDDLDHGYVSKSEPGSTKILGDN